MNSKIFSYLRILMEIILLVILTNFLFYPTIHYSYVLIMTLLFFIYVIFKHRQLQLKIIKAFKAFKEINPKKDLLEKYIRLIKENSFEKSFIEISSDINHYLMEKNDSIEKTNKLFQKVQQKNAILKITHDINNAFIKNDATDIFQLILQNAINLLPTCHYGSLLVYEEETQKFNFKAVNGYNFNDFKDINIDIKETFIYQYSDDGFNNSVVIDDIDAHNKEFMTKENANAISTKINTLINETLSIPIKVNDKIFGILNVDTKDHFSDSDIELLNYYANSIVFNLYNSQLLEKTIYLSRYDKLTGIYNRNYFEDLFSDIIDRTINENYSFSFVLIDMNYLKQFNDTYGHRVGDDALVHMTQIIKSHLTSEDVFARQGGDEFVLVLGRTNYSEGHKRVEGILNELLENKLVIKQREAEQEITVTFSYGLAACPSESLVLDILLKLADHRMYEFKENFKNEHPEYKPGY